MTIRQSILCAISISAFAALVSPGSATNSSPEGPYVPSDPGLFGKIARLDAEMFEAFNSGDIDAQGKFIDKTLEFFHDAGGVTDYDQFVSNSKRLFAQPDRARRELVAGSLEVYPIKDYGAIEVGRHRFWQQRDGKTHSRTYKFIHTWKKTGDEWKITRVISYDH